MASSSHLRGETVEALVEITTKLIDEEVAIAQGLQSRATALTGFAGVIVSVSGAFGRLFEDDGATGAVQVLALTTFGIGVIFLLLAVVAAVLMVLRPRPIWKISMREVERYPLPEFVYEETVHVHGRTLRGLVRTLAAQRDQNDVLGRWLLRAYVLATVGIAGIGAQALVVGYEVIL